MMKITTQEFEKNYKEGEILTQQNGWLSSKANNKGFAAVYISWTKVWDWMKTHYPNFRFEVEKIDIDVVVGSLYIDNERLGSTALSTETYTTGKERPEALVNRVFVKLVAQYTGFGFHLWLNPPKPESKTTRRI